jgi:YD repeat-containing protein
VTKETVAPGAGSALSLVTDISYDTCGNVNSISSYPAGQSGQARTTTLGYGTRCQLPESITNPLNQTSNIAYNWPLALPSSHTDPNGIATGLIYDGFGRLKQRNNPDLTDVVFSLTACTAGNGWCGKTSAARMKVTQVARTTSDAVIRTEEQFVDGSGRVRWSHSDSLESGPAVVATLYDAFGRPTARSQPYFTGGGIYWTQVTYDLIGRPTQQDAAIDESSVSGRITGFAYEGRDLKITDPRTFFTTRPAGTPFSWAMSL